jgi:predicted nucleic acid-binding protein
MVFPVIILDSSFLISFFRDQDVNNGKAMDLAEKYESEEMVLSDVILFETLTVIAYKDGIPAAKIAYEWIAGNRKIRYVCLTYEEKQEIIGEFLSQQKKTSIADASVVYLAKRSKSPILALDEGLLRLSKKQ